jgi:hypothetical protein
MLANVGFSALLEGGQSDFYLYGFRLLARRYDAELYRRSR